MEEETDTSHCPFCEAPLDESTEPIERLRESLELLRIELGDVDLERPRINRHIEELREREAELGETMRRLRLQIEAVVSEDDALRADEDLDDRRSRLAGSAETLLEALPADTQQKDLSEVLAGEDLSILRPAAERLPRVAFHSPCTLQHGQKLDGVVEKLLQDLGFALTPVPDSHLCCGSAGTYSILQKKLSMRLRQDKVTALNRVSRISSRPPTSAA